MRNYILVILVAAAALQLHALLVDRTAKKILADPVSDTVESCPSMFIAVLTTVSGATQRSLIRKMWREAGEGYGNVSAKFAICTGGTMTDELETEQLDHGDLLLMDDCEEGYDRGRLTKKVETAMKTYLKYFSSYDLFMKVDDDTFVSTRRLCNLLLWRKENSKDNMAAYLGVFAEGPREAILGNHTPSRDPEDPWYEPFENFDGEFYPTSAKGGPGYVLSRHLVQPIIEQGIAAANMLYNEDKAVGVWVDQLVTQGIHVDIVNVPGTDGYPEHADSYNKSGPFFMYKAALHHHLTGNQIACLHEVDHTLDPERTIDHCFEANYLPPEELIKQELQEEADGNLEPERPQPEVLENNGTKEAVLPEEPEKTEFQDADGESQEAFPSLQVGAYTKFLGEDEQVQTRPPEDPEDSNSRESFENLANEGLPPDVSEESVSQGATEEEYDELHDASEELNAEAAAEIASEFDEPHAVIEAEPRRSQLMSLMRHDEPSAARKDP